MQDTGKRLDMGANKPVSNEEMVVAKKKVKRKYRLRNRRLLPSCGKRATRRLLPRCGRSLEERKSPHLLPVSGCGLVLICSLLFVFMVRKCGGGQCVL